MQLFGFAIGCKNLFLGRTAPRAATLTYDDLAHGPQSHHLIGTGSACIETSRPF